MANLLEMSLQLDSHRAIIHVDMDAFYAQIEMRDRPELRDEILVLARDPRKHSGRGVVATANYHARQLGIHSAMNAAQALKLAPDAVFITPDFKKYRETSAQVHRIFRQYTEKIEAIALDEAYLDVTDFISESFSVIQLAHELQQTIYEKLQLTCSIGVSFNKFLAKLASEHNKPVGFTVIREADVRNFLDSLPITDIRGVGEKTAQKMMALNIETGADLYQTTISDLMKHFGKAGYDFYQHIRGIDNRPVKWQRQRKSIGTEQTYARPIDTDEQVLQELQLLATKLAESLKNKQIHGKTLVLKIRDDEFNTETKRRTQLDYIDANSIEIFELAHDIWEEMGGYQQPLRLIGLTMTNLAPIAFENVTLNLFDD